jgi:peroxiredoxin
VGSVVGNKIIDFILLSKEYTMYDLQTAEQKPSTVHTVPSILTPNLPKVLTE